MFYNGNLTNGSAALRTAFGSYVKEGTVVGVLCERNQEQTIVSFFVDGVYLGPAFSLSSDSTETYFPCLHVGGKSTVEVSFPELLPSKDVDASKQAYMDTKYEGQWKLSQLMVGPELGEKPLPNHEFLAQFESTSANTIGFSMKIGNTLRTNITTLGEKDGYEMISVGNVMSTMMLSPPPIQSVEDDITGHLPSALKMKSAGKKLLVIGTTIELHFTRHFSTRPPVTEYK